MIKLNKQEDDPLGLYWEVVSFITDRVVIRLDFKNKLLLSQGGVKDQLVVEILDISYFQQIDNKIFDMDTAVLVSRIPKLLLDDPISKSLSNSTENMETSMNAVSVTSLGMNFAMAMSLN